MILFKSDLDFFERAISMLENTSTPNFLNGCRIDAVKPACPKLRVIFSTSATSRLSSIKLMLSSSAFFEESPKISAPTCIVVLDRRTFEDLLFTTSPA